MLSWILAKMQTADRQLHDITRMSRIYILHSTQLIVYTPSLFLEVLTFYYKRTAELILKPL